MPSKPYLILVPLVVAIFVAVIFIDKKRNNEVQASDSSGAIAESGYGGESTRESETNARSARRQPRGSGDKYKKISTKSGLVYQVIKKGTGARPGPTDKVTVTYRGYLLDGTEFDRSPEGRPASFPLNQVIPGWTEGVQLMRVGASYRFTIPAELAYGNRAAGDKIPPNSTLVFDVELLSVGE